MARAFHKANSKQNFDLLWDSSDDALHLNLLSINSKSIFLDAHVKAKILPANPPPTIKIFFFTKDSPIRTANALAILKLPNHKSGQLIQ